MGVRAARFVQGRLLMHDADGETPETVIENASRSDQKIVATTLATLPDAIKDANVTGPAILFLGLAPREALAAADTLPRPKAMKEAL